MTRKYRTIGQKLAILKKLDQALEEGRSACSFAWAHDICPKVLRDWKKQELQLAVMPKKKKTLHRGRESTIKHLEEELLAWFNTQRALGGVLSYRILQARTCRLHCEFREIDHEQQYGRIRCLCHANGIVIRRTTTTSKKKPEEVEQEARQWLDNVRPMITAPGVNRRYVLNMDQTPVFFNLAPHVTLDTRGKKKIVSRIAGGNGDRVTATLCVSAAGDKLKPMLIFRGAPAGYIVKREFPVYQNRERMVLACQEHAWQDNINMLCWVDEVLRPHLQERAEGAPVHLFLDSFSAHKSKSTITALTNLGVNVIQIPVRCTGLVQPVDVGVGKPFKDRVRGLWWDWIIDQDPDLPIFTNAGRAKVADWIVSTWENMPEEIICNAWKKTDFAYIEDN